MVLGASGGPPRSLSLTDFIFYFLFFIFPFLPVLSYDFFLFFFNVNQWFDNDA
jgi:hypothetical protein